MGNMLSHFCNFFFLAKPPIFGSSFFLRSALTHSQLRVSQNSEHERDSKMVVISSLRQERRQAYSLPQMKIDKVSRPQYQLNSNNERSDRVGSSTGNDYCRKLRHNRQQFCVLLRGRPAEALKGSLIEQGWHQLSNCEIELH